MTKIYETMAIVDGRVAAIDTIEFQGGLWLVPMWLDQREQGWTSPEYIVRLDALAYDPVLAWPYRPNYWLNVPLPKDVYEGRAHSAPGQRFEVVHRPSLRIDVPTGLH